MPGFCVQCGTPLAAGARFCEACGAAVAGATPTPPSPAPPSPAPVYAAPAPPIAAPARVASGGGGSTAVKVILIVLAVLMFLGLLAAGSCFYVAYRVKRRVHELSGNAAPYTGSRDPCAKLSASEASTILGEPVQSAEAQGDTCEYHLGSDGSRILAVQYTWQGAGMVMRLTTGTMKSGVAGMNMLQPVNGIGDEALLMPMGSGLMMRKGDVLVHIDMRVANVSVDAAENMARTIAGRL